MDELDRQLERLNTKLLRLGEDTSELGGRADVLENSIDSVTNQLEAIHRGQTTPASVRKPIEQPADEPLNEDEITDLEDVIREAELAAKEQTNGLSGSLLELNEEEEALLPEPPAETEEMDGSTGTTIGQPELADEPEEEILLSAEPESELEVEDAVLSAELEPEPEETMLAVEPEPEMEEPLLSVEPEPEPEAESKKKALTEFPEGLI
jgi:hypothetical protein